MGKVILNITIFADQVCVRVCVCVYVCGGDRTRPMIDIKPSVPFFSKDNQM